MRLNFSLLLLLSSWSLFAQGSTHIRVFRPSGSYPANITVSPNGSVLSRSGDSPNLLILDGFTRREIRIPIETSFRVYQSRSAQLWSVTKDGLQLFHADQWTLHYLPEIRNELANNPIRQLRQINLLPAEVNHVLILLSDRLLDYDASTGQTRLLKEASSTGLGEFLEMQQGIDESIWISGTFGFAHLQGPARRVTPQSSWGEFLLPNTNRINTLQRPFEFPAGTVTASANSATADGSRNVVRLEGDRFSSLPVPLEKIKQGWGAWDGTIWGFSTIALFRIEQGAEVPLRKEPVSGAQYDMASETNGAFWIASSQGLVRHAPFLWRPPPGLDDLQASTHSLVFDRSTLWCANPEGLIRIQGQVHETFPWPEAIENLVPPRDSLFLVPEGRLLVGAAGRPFLFDPPTKRFDAINLPAGAKVHLLGQLRDGSVCAWFEGAPDASVDLRVFNGTDFEPLTLPAFTTKGAELFMVRETIRGDLWIGTTSGLIQVRRNEGTVEYHGRDQGLANERVTALAELGEGRIWCGTESFAYEYNDLRWEKRLSTPDRVNAIVSAFGSIWVATPAGLYRLFQGSWISHGVNEGIPPGGVYALKLTPSDDLWAASSRGLVMFHPDADPDPPRTLPPVVQDPETPSTVEPTVISFRGQDKWDYTLAPDLLFSYRLDEAPWTPYSNITSRVFQNLSSGAHVIEVRAMDRNGNQAPSATRVEFAVIVPWFQDPRLLVVSIVALCLSLFLAGYALNKHFQLKKSYAEVEKIVRQRTGELQRANEELLHGQKMRAIGTMAAGIAHDFNNILSIIKGSAQIIEGNVDDKEKIKTRINRIQTVVDQGTSIVKALLGLGRIHQQKLTACDIGDLLHQTRKLLSDRFSADVHFEVDCPPELPKTLCSPEVLQQMLLNFILNAVEAMGGKGLVRLSANETGAVPPDLVLEPSKEESYIVITVADQGTGIPAESLPRIFEPFYTTKGFSSRRGTGLGLSMVYELAKGLGYGVAVRTMVGEGSAFSIVLPATPELRTKSGPSQNQTQQPSSHTFEG